MLIAQRLDSDVSLADLATQAGGHPDALGASFRRRFGLTPVAYRLRLRLQLAGKLLLGNRVTVAEAAKAVGFNDPAYFARVFKRAHGLSPRDWAHR
jgi:AraC-like DNA-binding protein